MHLTFIGYDLEPWDDCTCWLIDLTDEGEAMTLFVCFGNGNFDEARVVGGSEDTLDYFRNMMNAGGYQKAEAPSLPGTVLYKDGDGCYPKEFPFVFVCPVPDPELPEWPPAIPRGYVSLSYRQAEAYLARQNLRGRT